MPKFDINEDLIRKLAGLLDETGLNEIEYESAQQRVRVARGPSGSVTVATPMAQTVAEAPAVKAAGAEAPAAGAVTSPMVGTVFLAPEPGAPPFVQVGDAVKEGQTLMIIEAMKVMNPLASPRAGKVAQILISDGDPVEYGEPLLVVE